jgi:hypothetical protein
VSESELNYMQIGSMTSQKFAHLQSRKLQTAYHSSPIRIMLKNSDPD